MYRLLLVVMLLFQLQCYGQIDQRKLDSLSKAIDSSSAIYKKQQDVVIKTQDSIYRSEISKNLQSSRDADRVVVGQKQRVEQRQKDMVRLMAGILLFLILIIVLSRKRKQKA